MKSLLTLCSVLLFWATASAQSVRVESICLSGEVNFVLDEAASPDESGRQVYFDADQDLEIRFNSTNQQWEIRSRSTQQLAFTSTFPATPNPPDSQTASWQGQNDCAAAVVDVSGEGTQSVLAAGLAIAPTDPCQCLNNASPYDMHTGAGGDDGTFAETVTISADAPLPTGLTFALIMPTQGVLDVSMIPAEGQPAAGLSAATDGSVQFTYEAGVYRLHFVHRSALGYSLTVALLADDVPLLTIDIGNTCFYPQARITSALEEFYCPLSDPVLLTGSVGTASGTGSFFINGSPATVFEPSLLSPGKYTISYHFAAGSAGAYLVSGGDVIGPPAGVETLAQAEADPGCTAVAIQTVEVLALPQSFACFSQVNVNLQEDCATELLITQVAGGDFRCADLLDEFTLIIGDAQPGNGPIVDGCGTYRYTLTGPLGVDCGGTIVAQDKTPPQITCPETPIADYVCTDIEEILLDGSWIYTTDAEGNIRSIPPELQAVLDLTGYPFLSDNCGDLRIVVRDELQTPDDACELTVIQRTFEVSDACGGGTASCTQSIFVGLPELMQVRFPLSPLEVDCADDFAVDVNGRPHPDVTGYPSIATVFDQHEIVDVYCNLTATYEDSNPAFICSGSYSIIRNWKITDWCIEEVIRIPQVIKVVDDGNPQVLCPEIDHDGDGQADLLTYSTGAFDCTASFAVPMPRVSDDCSEWTVRTELLNSSINGPVMAVIEPGASRFVSGIPPGCHFIKYTVDDDCGNRTIAYCPFVVEDLVAPTALCVDDLNVSLGGGGIARVLATEIDRGSHDNCGPVRLEVRRRIKAGADYGCLEAFDYDQDGRVVGDEIQLDRAYGDPDGQGLGQEYYFTPWEEYVDFTCCDIGVDIHVEFRVWDDRNGDGQAGNTQEVGCTDPLTEVTDNFNVCWLNLNVEDKLRPHCIPPLPVTINCDELPLDFESADTDKLQNLFGIATGTDNCPGFTIAELPPDQSRLDDCGFGVIVRNFRVTDAQGQISTNDCRQRVTISEDHHYKIKFPKDAASTCSTADPDTIILKELGCDLLAVSSKDDFFSASGDECYKIRRTYQVINWCEYDGISDPVVVSRDEDCDGDPGDEDVWVIVATREGDDPCQLGNGTAYEHVWYDRDDDPFNQEPAAGVKGRNCDGQTNPTGFWKELQDITNNTPADTEPVMPLHCETRSVGYWQYTQLITVYDDVDPLIEFEAPAAFCSYSSEQDAGCPTAITLAFSIEENCTPNDLSVLVFLDEFRDGVLDANLSDQLMGSYPTFQITGSFPLGAHELLISVRDGCGNQTTKKLPFEVIDCKAPVPSCINGLVVELMPIIPAADVNNDGIPDGAAMTIWARDFVASPVADCSVEVRFSINRMGEAAQSNQTGLVLTCDDDPNLLIEIWAWDEAGNGDFCETYVLIQDNMVSCNELAGGTIAGTVTNELGEPLQHVRVELSGNQDLSVLTAEEGQYRFSELEEGFDYTVLPYLDAQPLNGVSTFDLVLMSKHILGLDHLDSPYKMIAADVNNSRTITTLDAIQLRRLILSINTRFSNNTSWRFIPKDYVFSDPANPWQEPFPEVININNLQGIVDQQDFIGIKIGDLNFSAVMNAQAPEARSVAGLLSLSAPDLQLSAGQEHVIPIRALDLAGIEGYQFTLRLDPAYAEIKDLQYGLAKATHFGFRYLSEGVLTTSWHRTPDKLLQPEEHLFSLVIRARRSASLRQILSVNSRITPAEAYHVVSGLLGVDLDFSLDESTKPVFALHQNTPNPFNDHTLISFFLPQAGEVTLRVHDTQGRTVYEWQERFPAGAQHFRLRAEELSQRGVLFYTLTAGPHTATRRMIHL